MVQFQPNIGIPGIYYYGVNKTHIKIGKKGWQGQYLPQAKPATMIQMDAGSDFLD